VKKLSALVLIAGLLAMGCSSGGGSGSKPKPSGVTPPPSKETPPPSKEKPPPSKEKPPVEANKPVIESVTAENASVAADKDSADVTLTVAAKDVTGDITIKITPPKELTVTPDTVTVEKGKKTAMVKVGVAKDTKREKDETYDLAIKATTEGAKEPYEGKVSVKVLKKAAAE
jgi:hypothetical protein